ncbi:MAG: phosphatase PAP2 family protein, partial [Bradymonadaceae bacterium]
MAWRQIGTYLGLIGLLVAYGRIHTFGPEHAAMLGLMVTLGTISQGTRDFLISVAPMIIFGWVYSFMHVFRERAADVVSVESIYRLEQTLFGWMTPEPGDLGPVDFFRDHHHLVFDALGGVLYATHMPAVIAFGIYLWWLHYRPPSDGARRRLDRLMWGFLFMSVIGLAIQALFPVASPWYPEKYGFAPPHRPIPGDPAALARVDAALGFDYFEGVYSQASYIFGAFPSLHVASPVWSALNVRHRMGRVAAWG